MEKKDRECIKCNSTVTDRFRMVWDSGQKSYHYLCNQCSRKLEALVAEKGQIGLLSMDNPRFVCWLREDRFMSYEEYLGIA